MKKKSALRILLRQDTINQIGGLSALIPILEQVEIIDQGAPLRAEEAARLSMGDVASIESDPADVDFVFVPNQLSGALFQAFFVWFLF